MVTDELFGGVGDFVVSCQNYDGGIAGERGVEAHGGTYMPLKHSVFNRSKQFS